MPARRPARRWLPPIVVGITLIALFTLLFTATLAAPTATSAGSFNAQINELRIDHSGTDIDEYFEIAESPGTSLLGLTYIVIGDGAGGSGTVEGVFTLTGNVPADGLYVVASISSTLVVADQLFVNPTNNFENSDNVTHLLVEGFSGSDGMDLDTNDDGVLDLTPWSAIQDCVGLLETPGSGDLLYCEDQVGPDGTFVPGQAYWCPTGWEIGAFSVGVDDTPGAPNVCAVAINEVRIDQGGSDDDEYFELSGASSASLDGLTYLVIGDGAGDSGTIEAVVDLTGTTIPADGYFLAAEGTMTIGVPDLVTSLNFENSDNVTHLLVRDFSGSNGDDLDTNDDGTLDSTPWSDLVSLIALVEEENPPTGTEWHYGPPSVGPDGTFVPGHAFLCPPGWEIGDFNVGVDDTAGTANDCSPEPPPPVGMCGDSYTTTYAIQGNMEGSPFELSNVVVEAVVIGDFQPGLDGFFIQDPTGDGDDETSDGLFVDAAGAVDVAAGDTVRVAGVVLEANGQTVVDVDTMLTDTIQICGSFGAPAATVVTLPVPPPTISDTEYLERYEGMLITTNPVSVTDHFNLGRFGEMIVSADGRMYIPTNGQGDTAALNARRQLLVDDGSTASDLAVVPYLGPDNTLRLGDSVTGLEGALGYNFGNYRLQPTVAPTISRTNPRPGPVADVGGNLKVASFNVLNYWTTIDDGVNDARGADSLAELARQQEKLVAAILGLDADILGLQELENNGAALESLVQTINLSATVPYTIAPGMPDVVSTNAIKVAIIYRPSVVNAVGLVQVDSDAAAIYDRPPVAQSFEKNGHIFTVVDAHFKSKSCSGATGGDQDQGDGQGCFNLTRTMQAQQMLTFTNQIAADIGDSDFLLVGDLNSYGEEDPILAIDGLGWDNVVDLYVPLLERYSYVFFGESGTLDYGFSTPGFTHHVTGATIWHINADEPRALDYNDDIIDNSGDSFNPAYLYNPDAYKSSDHDPVLIGLNMTVVNANPITTTYFVDEGAGTAYITFTLNHPLDLPSSISYSTFDGTAVEPDDYTAVNGTLDFPAGSIEGVVQIPIVDDAAVEGDETLFLSYGTLEIGTPPDALNMGLEVTLVIVDNDSPPTAVTLDDLSSRSAGSALPWLLLAAATLLLAGATLRRRRLL